MAQYETMKAFALTDHPFHPDAIDGIPWKYLKDIHNEPLLIYEDHRLLQLYCSEAGPFERHGSAFRDLIAPHSYRLNPPTRGRRSFVFLIAGDGGTGKTTLANVMVDHIKQCTVQGDGSWVVKDPWRQIAPTGYQEQCQGIERVRSELDGETKPDDYCCIILNNIVSGSEEEAFKSLYYPLKEDRVVFLFLTTSSPELRQKDWAQSPHPVHLYRMETLTADEAVAFVKHRLRVFRKDPPPMLADCPLFPFEEGNLRRTAGITLRMLNRMLTDAIDARTMALPEDFNVRNLGGAELGHHMIDLFDTYRSAVRNVVQNAAQLVAAP